MGAVALTNMKQGIVNNRRVVEATVTFSSSYATNGDTVSCASLGLNQVSSIHIPSQDLAGTVVPDSQSQSGKTIQLGGTIQAPKLKVYDTANTEISNGTSLATLVRIIRFYGT